MISTMMSCTDNAVIGQPSSGLRSVACGVSGDTANSFLPTSIAIATVDGTNGAARAGTDPNCGGACVVGDRHLNFYPTRANADF